MFFFLSLFSAVFILNIKRFWTWYFNVQHLTVFRLYCTNGREAKPTCVVVTCCNDNKGHLISFVMWYTDQSEQIARHICSVNPCIFCFKPSNLLNVCPCNCYMCMCMYNKPLQYAGWPRPRPSPIGRKCPHTSFILIDLVDLVLEEQQPRHNRGLVSTRQLCVCAAQVQMSTLIYEDVSTWSMIIPFHNNHNVPLWWSAFTLLARKIAPRVISENQTKRWERNTIVKNICVPVSVHSHVTSYCVLPLCTNVPNCPDCWLAVVASTGMLST